MSFCSAAAINVLSHLISSPWLSPTFSSNNLCHSCLFLIAHVFISISCSLSSPWTHWIDLKPINYAVGKKKQYFFTNHTDLHLNLPRNHLRCGANWAVMEKNWHACSLWEEESVKRGSVMLFCTEPVTASLFVPQTCCQAPSTASASPPWKATTRAHRQQWTPGPVSEMMFMLHCKKSTHPLMHVRHNQWNTALETSASQQAGVQAHLSLYV